MTDEEIKKAVSECRDSLSQIKKEMLFKKHVFFLKLIFYVIFFVCAFFITDAQNEKLFDIEDRVFRLTELATNIDYKMADDYMYRKYFS